MCLAIPGKIKKIEENIAFFDYAEQEYQADISLAPKVEVGDWILMHDGRALSKVSEEEAHEQLHFIEENEEFACHSHKH
jgi:hydrogenase expression/formation protein HypC